MKDLIKFSGRLVYINIRHDLQDIVTCLQDNVQLSDQQPWNDKLTEKARESKQILGKLIKVQFLLRLVGCAAVYGQYGKKVNLSQIVDLLPHEH